MRIEGNLATYEFSDLLQWLAQGNKTGVLTVTDGGVEYKLGFDHGRIDMSSSSDPEQRLDTYLHRKGVIDDATLARAERLREATQMMSGQVLVTLGAVTELELAQALRDKTEQILCELLTWERGTFEFEGGERSESTMVPISLEVTKLLLESMHRLDQGQQGDAPERPAPAAVFAMPEPARPQPPADATQAIEGLALAEVLDPEAHPADAPPAPVFVPPPEGASESEVPEELPPHYAVMTQSPGALRRIVPYALVALLSVGAGAFYLANVEATAEAVDVGPGGEPILFTQTSGPRPSPPPLAPEPAAAQPVESAEAAAPAEIEDVEGALRREYEEQLAGLRRELEEARRLARPTPPTARGETPTADLPADSIMRAAVARPAPVPPPPDEPVSRPEPMPAATETIVPAEVVAEKPPPPVAPATPEPVEAAPPERPAPSLSFVNPTLLSRPVPRYPESARRLGRGATVVVRVLVGADGRVVEVERTGAKAGMGFDRAAEMAARASTWTPGTRAGEPTEMWADLRFEFRP